MSKYTEKVLTDELENDPWDWENRGNKKTKDRVYPKTYFKCRNNNCPAKKAQQPSDNDPEMFEIQYKNNHNHNPSEKPWMYSVYRSSPNAAGAVNNDQLTTYATSGYAATDVVNNEQLGMYSSAGYANNVVNNEMLPSSSNPQEYAASGYATNVADTISKRSPY